jgi:hypothetical protein
VDLDKNAGLCDKHKDVVGTRAAASLFLFFLKKNLQLPLPTQRPIQISSVTSLPLFPLHPSPQAQSPPVPLHSSARIQCEGGRGRHGGDAGGRAAEGKWMPRRLAPPRSVASQIREFPFLSYDPILAFGPFSSVRPTQPGGWWWRRSATTLDALAPR